MNLLDELWTQQPAFGQQLRGEFRLIKEGQVTQRWVPLPMPAGTIEDIQRHDVAGYDCYFGVLPRTQTRGTAEACVPETHVLWADVDAKNTGGKWAGLVGIRQFRLTPTVIVDSGRGWHVYWFLKEPVPFSHAHEAMRWIAREVRGDAVYDQPRVLRIPGTHNHKTDPPTPVRVIFWDTERRYRISDFDTIYDEPAHQERVRRDFVYHDLPGWLVDLIEGGVPRGQRSEACFKVMVWLVRFGRTDEWIEEAFKSTPNGIGQKLAEKKKDGQRWFDLTLAAAKKANHE